MLNVNDYIELNVFLLEFKDIIDISVPTIKSSNKSFIKTIEKTFLINKNYLNIQVELYKHSKSIKYLSEKLSKLIECTTTQSVSLLINNLKRRHIPIYSIPLFSKEKFISNDDFNAILDSAQYIAHSDCYTAKEVLEKINELFILGGYTQIGTSTIKNVMKENNLEFISYNSLANFTGFNLLTKKDTMLLLCKMKNIFETKILALNNLSIEDYYTLSIDKLLKDFIIYDDIEYILKEFISFPKHSTDYGFNYKLNLFKNTNIRVVGIRSPVCKIFINKNDFYETIETLRNYVSIYDIQKTLNLSSIDSKAFINQDIQVHSDLPLITEGLFVKKKDAERFISSYNYKKELSDATTIFEKYSVKLKYYPNTKEKKIPKTLKLFNDYILQKSNKRTTSGSIDSAFFEIYNILCDTLNVDLTILEGEELNKELNKLLFLCSHKCRTKEAWIGFVNFLRNTDDNFYNIDSFKLVLETKKVEPYSSESFINLAIALIDIIENKDLLKKTYYDWNVSSALCYVFLHLCLAWRRNDLTMALPTPNLNLIDNLSKYNNFIDWLEDGNELSERVSLSICKDIETKVKRFNVTARKNQQNLVCIIPKFLSKHLALLLCINETNRQWAKTNNKKIIRFDRVFTKSGIENITKIFSDKFNTDLTTILGDSFNNIKATKSFLTLITEKSEEFGLAYGYYLSQKLRAHKSSPEMLSNTTKIYLDKDVSKASVMAFAIGTMGSVKYNLLSLIDDEFNNMSLLNQTNSIIALNMSPYKVETTIKTLAIKSDEIKKTLLTVLTTKEKKDKFLAELLYGKSCYGKHEDTKCLFKIIKSIDNTVNEISVRENEKCPFRTESCIGCIHLISKRYFMYFVEDKFNKLLDSLENAVSDIDKEIHIGRLQEIYLPTILDMFEIFGKQTISTLLNTKRYKELIQSLS